MTSYDFLTECNEEETGGGDASKPCREAEDLQLVMYGLKAAKKSIGEVNGCLNRAGGKINKLERENKRLKDELEALTANSPESEGIEQSHCLDADGVPIEVGDEVYLVDAKGEPIKSIFSPYKVDGIGNGIVKLRDKDGYQVAPFRHVLELTHRKPDSWEQVVDDVVAIDPPDYVAEVLGENVCDTTWEEDKEEMRADILRRIKRLAGVENG